MKNGLTVSLRYHCLCLSLALMFAGCKGKDGFDGEKAPYGPRTPTTEVRSTLTYSPTSTIGGVGNSQVTTVVGQTTIAGVTYDRLATTQIDKPGKGGEYWIKQDDKGMVAFAGFSHSDLHANLVPAAATTFASPIMLNLNAPIGQPQTVTTTASVKLAGATTASTAQLTGQYTLVEKDVSVATGVGPLAGCSHFTGEAQTDSPGIPALFRGRTVKADLWHHPSYGVVAFNVPEIGIGTVMTDASDCGSVDASNHRTIRKTGVVDGTSSLKLETYVCDGNQFAADKNTHASMLLELRWVDEAQAKTDLEPGPRVEFGTTMGYFPHMMAESPTSVFHPEENGKGFKYWYAYVNQAAKNAPGDESETYHIYVKAVQGLAPVRATGRLYYKVLPDRIRPMPDSGVSPSIGADGGSVSTPDTSLPLDTRALDTAGTTTSPDTRALDTAGTTTSPDTRVLDTAGTTTIPDAGVKDVSAVADTRPDTSNGGDTAGGCGTGPACSAGQQCLSGQCCAPPAAGGTCSANPACGCPSGQVCAPSTTRVMACFAGNNVAEGADCSAGLTCRAGFGCFDGICRPYCNTDADCPAVAGVQSCLATYWDDQQTQAILGLKVCARICDPTRPQNPHSPLLSCPAGFACGSAPTGASFCFKAGASPAGAACTSTANCLPGYVCTGASATALVCTTYCLSTSDCAAGTTCQFAWSPRQYAGNQEVGYCQ